MIDLLKVPSVNVCARRNSWSPFANTWPVFAQLPCGVLGTTTTTFFDAGWVQISHVFWMVRGHQTKASIAKQKKNKTTDRAQTAYVKSGHRQKLVPLVGEQEKGNQNYS